MQSPPQEIDDPGILPNQKRVWISATLRDGWLTDSCPRKQVPIDASTGIALAWNATPDYSRSSNTQRKPTGGLSSRGNMLTPRDHASNHGVGGHASGGKCCRS